MKRIIAWTLTVIAGPLIVAFLQPHLPAALSLSWPWLIAMSEWSGLPWVLAGSLGLIAGIWLDKWLSWFDGRNPIWAKDKARKLAPEASRLGYEILHSMKGVYGPSPPRESDFIRVTVMLKKLSRIGLRTPSPSSLWQSPNEMMAGLANYLISVSIPMQEGDIAMAMDVSDQLVLRLLDGPAQ